LLLPFLCLLLVISVHLCTVFRVTFKAGETNSAVIPLAWRVSFLFFSFLFFSFLLFLLLLLLLLLFVAQYLNLGRSSLVLRFLDHTELDKNTPASTPLNE